MRKEALLVALTLVLATMPAFALPTPPPGPFTPRGPINIQSNADFTTANGVVSGTGAPGNPFVISGWSFATSQTAIRIHNVSVEFVIRHNAIDAGVGVHITSSTSIGVIDNNQFVVRGTGVLVANADATIIHNSFIGLTAGGATGKGVDLVTSNSRVESNAFLYLQFGVRAERGSPSILCNDMHDDVIVWGVHVRLTTNATISCNIITQCTAAIRTELAIGTIIANNSITSCYKGIEAVLTKDVNITNNTVRFSLYSQVFIDTTSGNFTGNLVIHGRADAVVILRSPVLVANNTIAANLRAGIIIDQSAPDVRANVVSNSSVGIVLTGNSVAHLEANVMVNNTIGIDIPYSSRQTIVNMSANLVNGVNIDGSLNASQRVYFYHASNVSITGQVRDSGFSAGYYGSLTAQGGVVLYETDTVNVNATVISHHTIGISAVNSFNVNVNGSFLLSNLIGVTASVNASVGQVPPCVVSVKDTNVTIPVDPVATVGIDIKAGCLGILGNVTVSIVDVGIKVAGNAAVQIFNSTVSNTRIGIDVTGGVNLTNITGSTFANNRIGARFSGTVGVIANNTFRGNAEVGIRLENGAILDLQHNNVSENGVGLFDAEVCGGPATCSVVHGRGNRFLGNQGAGVDLNGASTWRGDVASGNQGHGFDLASSTTMRGVVASGNEGDGARIVGTFEIRTSVFTGNEGDGLDVRGSGTLDDSNFTFNGEAGIRIDATTSVRALHINASFNFDGILAETAAVGPPGAPPSLSTGAILPYLWSGGTSDGISPIDVHRSVLMRNERDSIRVGLALMNATHNYFGTPTGPPVNVADTVGAFQNGVSPLVRFVPYYVDPSLTTVGPVFLL